MRCVCVYFFNLLKTSTVKGKTLYIGMYMHYTSSWCTLSVCRNTFNSLGDMLLIKMIEGNNSVNHDVRVMQYEHCASYMYTCIYISEILHFMMTGLKLLSLECSHANCWRRAVGDGRLTRTTDICDVIWAYGGTTRTCRAFCVASDPSLDFLSCMNFCRQ